MLSRRTIRRPLTGVFQMPVWTVLPCQVTSRGRPTLTESKCPIAFPNDHHRNPVNPGRFLCRSSETFHIGGFAPLGIPPVQQGAPPRPSKPIFRAPFRRDDAL